MDFKNFSLLCWNIRGVINVVGRRHSRELIRQYRPSMVVLIETHSPFQKSENF